MKIGLDAAVQQSHSNATKSVGCSKRCDAIEEDPKPIEHCERNVVAGEIAPIEYWAFE